MKILNIIPLLLFLSINNLSGEEFSLYHELSKKPENIGKYRIYRKDEILFCTGDDPAGTANNRASELMERGEFAEALLILEDGMEHAPLFFPFRYNAGICALYLNRLHDSLMHFTKAKQLVPEYYRTYLQIGYVFGRLNRESDAIEQYRIGLKKNPTELNTYILIGDIHFERNQLRTAKKYYETATSINRKFPNGLLGLAKIEFMNKKYNRTIILLKSIDTSADYDKSYHYYYAESAFKTADYKTAVEQYETLLKFSNDRFFLLNSKYLINHKLSLAKRFTER